MQIHIEVRDVERCMNAALRWKNSRGSTILFFFVCICLDFGWIMMVMYNGETAYFTRFLSSMSFVYIWKF